MKNVANEIQTSDWHAIRYAWNESNKIKKKKNRENSTF